MKHRPLVLLAVSLAVLAAVAAVTLAVTTLLGVTFQGAQEPRQPVGSPEPPGSQIIAGPLMTDNRDRLAVCVQAVDVDPSVVNVAKSRIEAALVEVAQHPTWERYGLADAVASPDVDIGCPYGPPQALLPAFKYPIAIVRGRGVSVASKYRAFVFVLPPEVLNAFVGGSPLRQAEQEFLCEGDSCMEVTPGLYLSVDELNDAPFLLAWLEAVIGLEPAPFDRE